MKDFFEVLEELYKKVLLGATLENDNQDYVFYLNPAFSEQDGSTATFSECSHTFGLQGQHQPSSVNLATSSVAPVHLKSPSQMISAHEIKLLQLTVIKVLVTRILAVETEFRAKEKYKEIIKILLESADIDSKLICMFQNQDKLLAHMAANCLALLLYFQLKEKHFESHQDTSKTVNSLICFLEMLELLTASRIHLELHCTCQRIVFLKPSCVLDVITWPIQAFVKRKFIIFVKKCLLRKLGEDLCRGSVPSFRPPDCHLEGDMLALADAVLQAVALGLLRTLSIHGKPSCFGGGELQPGCEQVAGPDHVILRAASLLIIKSLEIKFQNCASVTEMQVDLQRFMSELLTFLKPLLQPSLQSHNPCAWLSRVFIEQDDDMLEAAKASMGIYLTLTRKCEATESLTQEKELWNHHTHENGYNPHCIFLFFLKSVGFDSTVLLDFLISSETCFLEYFVRYLKLLQKDWDEFFTVCKYFDVTESNDSITICGWIASLIQDRRSHQVGLCPLAALGSHRTVHTWASGASDASSKPPTQVVMSKETPATLQANHLSPRQASQSLVDYDSSDDSDVESTDLCLANGEQTSLYQEAMQKIQDTVGTSGDKKEHSLELQSRPPVPKESTTPVSVDCAIAPESIVSEVGMSYRTVKCFDELQGAISRLQKKNLFPYNPTALLKLLKQIEAIYNKSMNPL
ncbi:protein Lines homolog 1 isoform X3 [Rhinolophus ferrumequinum]|uniref:protein Lines homolog 1 isoform X3 n=1 Tax=Rhinolophus ferrumequinum TaxID=59479 RepID=UPI00140F5C39|nr:protein Lines homolog 1 isoform X3 [Rhinolophus ferrumequinum]